jgi:hypothetical protein
LAVDQLTAGTNTWQARQQALQAIPYHQLNQIARQKIAPILDDPSIYRRLPVTAINIDPDYYLFLVRQPEVVVNIWQIMGVTNMSVERVSPFILKSDDGAGASSNVELVYGTNNLHIFYAEGDYAGPLLKRKLKGSCVLVLRSEYGNGPNNVPQATSALDIFLKVENATASMIAKTINPLIGRTADHNFVESLTFLERLNETTEKNGVGVKRMAGRLSNVSPDVRERFIGVAGLVYERGPYASRQKPVFSPIQSHEYASPANNTTSQTTPAQFAPANPHSMPGRYESFQFTDGFRTTQPPPNTFQQIRSPLRVHPGQFPPLFRQVGFQQLNPSTGGR